MKLSQDAQDRLLSFGLGAGAWTVLGLALYLTPATEGFGTHRQLGLGQCTLLSLTGYACPMCGMTTTFSHMAHLQPIEAITTQPFGVVLFLLTFAVAVTALVEGIRPTGRWRRALAWLEHRELAVAGGLFAGLIAGWVFKLHSMGMIGA